MDEARANNYCFRQGGNALNKPNSKLRIYLMNKKILIFGSSGHAKVISEILERLNYEIVGYIDSFASVGFKVLDYKVLGDEYLLDDPVKKFGTNEVVIAVGENSSRFKVFKRLQKINKELEFPSIIAPSANVSKRAIIGRGTIIMNQVVVNSESSIGNFVILNTASVVEHECVIGDYASLAPGVLFGGNVCVGKKSFIGIGARIIQKVKIGGESVIGAGATVVRDIPTKVLAAGIPAKIIKRNYFNDKIFS